MHASHHHAEQEFEFTQHAIVRMNARGISREAVLAAITYGRVVYVRSARYFVLGRKEVSQYSGVDANLRRFEGIQVVCVANTVLTAFRDHDLSCLRKYKHAWRRGQGPRRRRDSDAQPSQRDW